MTMTRTLATLALLVGLAVPATAVLTPEQKCQQKKLKAQGKFQLCLKKNAAKMLGGHPDASAECGTKFADALTKAGTCRYLDNADGTVSDLDTGLMWEQKTADTSVHDQGNAYTWSATGSAPDGTAFTEFLGILVSGCFAGHCDWRLPTMEELLTILLAPCGTLPCIDTTFVHTQPGYYWSSTSGANEAGAWIVDFAGVSAGLVLKSNHHVVRAARGGFALPAVQAQPATPDRKCQQKKLKAQGKFQLCLKKNAAKMLGGQPDASTGCSTKFADALTKAGTCRYLDNGDGTVSDLDTGLVWEKKDDLGGVHDTDALYTWCADENPPDNTCDAPGPAGTAYTTFLAALNGSVSNDGVTITGCFAGRCDWRLPTVSELAAIRSGCPACSPAFIDPIFGPTQIGFHWTSTTGAGGPTNAWGVWFNALGHLGIGGEYTTQAYVRAVRGGL